MDRGRERFVIALTRRYVFPAAHVLSRPDRDEGWNLRVYGKCANPAGHGHDYGLEVSVTGNIQAGSGRIAEPEQIDEIVRERVLERFGFRLLNGDPAFSEVVPTAENIARVIHDELEAPLADVCGARLVRVRLHETRRNSFAYGELR